MMNMRRAYVHDDLLAGTNRTTTVSPTRACATSRTLVSSAAGPRTLSRSASCCRRVSISFSLAFSSLACSMVPGATPPSAPSPWSEDSLPACKRAICRSFSCTWSVRSFTVPWSEDTVDWMMCSELVGDPVFYNKNKKKKFQPSTWEREEEKKKA